MCGAEQSTWENKEASCPHGRWDGPLLYETDGIRVDPVTALSKQPRIGVNKQIQFHHIMGYDLHIVREEDWEKIPTAPITKQDVDALIAADSELAWSTSDYIALADGAGVSKLYYMITWKGESCFWWYEDEIRCSRANEEQIAKLVEMARALNAHVVGDEGEIYPLEQRIELPAQEIAASTQKPALPAALPWPLWKRLVAGFLFGCVLLALKLLIFGH